MPTSNPVPSQDPSDLLFNAGKLDEVVNGAANSFTDRLGVARRTVAGMNADFDAQLADAESDLNVYRADAAASAAEALGYLQTIRATSYGAYASDPTTDPLGNPPTVGDEYFNTTANLLKRWNGTTWQASDINTANLAASSGSSLVGYDGGTVQDVLDGAKSLQDYTALRAYTGSAKRIYITGLLVTSKPSGIAGTFQYDPTDTTSADNGGTIIVSADGKRRKRDYTDCANPAWFCADYTGAVDCSSAVQAAINASNGRIDFGGYGTFKISYPVGLPTNYVTGTSLMVIKGSGAEILVDSAEAIFTSERSRATPDSTSDLYTAKINVTGLTFRPNGSAAGAVFNGDRLYNLNVSGCNFSGLQKVIYSYRNKGASYPSGYMQSVSFNDNHFSGCTRIVDAKQAFNFVFEHNKCETNQGGIYIDGIADPAISTFRCNNNMFEGGGLFLKIGAVLGGSIKNNYLEANSLGDVATLKCHIHMVRASGGYTTGFEISGNMFGATASQKTDTDWRDIKFAPGVVITGGGVRPPIITGNWTSSYQLFTEDYVAVSYGNGGPGGDVLSKRMRVPTPHQEAGVSFSRYTKEFLASSHLSAGVFTVAELSTADIKSLVAANSTTRAHTVELTLLIQNLTAGNVCVGASAAKILLVVQGAQGSGDVDTMFVGGSLVSFAQIPTGNVFDTRFSSEFKQHFTNPVLSIVPNGADNYYLKLSGYAAVSVANYGSADRIRTSGILQANASAFGNVFRGLSALV